MIELWIEGYTVSGNKADSERIGSYNVETLREAVIMSYNEASTDRRAYYNFTNLTYWGCRFYDNSLK